MGIRPPKRPGQSIGEAVPVDGQELSDDDRRRILTPPRQTEALPDVGGRLRARPEDFVVTEIPAYAADGREGHLLLTLKKRGWNTEQAVAEVARGLGIPRREIGVAGLKDRDAVTEQWISVPARAAAAIGEFSHPDLTLGEPSPHGQKLRRGHLRGNRFEIVLRDLVVPPEEAITRIRDKFDAIDRDRGLDNYYGEQRFGIGGANLDRGLAALGSPRRRRKADFTVSAGQSALFNLYLTLRAERGLLQTVMLGDVIKKTQTGGMFVCEDAATDQARLDAGELVLTGPIFGGKMRSPTPETPAHAFELEVLERVGLSPQALKALGRSAPGTRRPLKVPIDGADVAVAAAIAAKGPGSALCVGVCLRFGLPSGAYATNVAREMTGADC